MDALSVYFSTSGVTVQLFVPPLISFVVSVFTSMGGLSGAFLLLPFQMSCLGFTSPSVSSTNLVYNIVAIPGGAYRYAREHRMVWPLAWIIIAGTLPGVFLGYYLRIWVLPDPAAFKFFVGCVLLYVGTRLLIETRSFLRRNGIGTGADKGKIQETGDAAQEPQPQPRQPGPAFAAAGGLRYGWAKVQYVFEGRSFSFSTAGMFSLALGAGIIGGAYGIGGAALIAPFCVFAFRLPIHTIAGAALVGAFFTSVVGVVFYSMIPSRAGLSCAPDWPLGLLFGLGGFAGTYCGARLQKFVPPVVLRLMLGVIVFALAADYILTFFLW